MTQTATESTAQDAEVAAALGVGAAADEPEAQQDDQAQEAEDTAFEDLPSSWQEEIRRLRRENASNRVARRDTQTKQQQTDGDGDKTPSAQAIRAAEERGRKAATLENGVRLASAEVRASLAGAMTEEQIEDVIDDLNLSRFVTDDGDVDKEAVKHLRDKFVSILGKKTTPRPGHGQRQGAPSAKSNADLFGDWLNGS